MTTPARRPAAGGTPAPRTRTAAPRARTAAARTRTAAPRARTAAARTRTARTGAVGTGAVGTGAVGTGDLRARADAGARPRGRSTPSRPDLWLVPDGESARRAHPGRRTRRAPFMLLVLALLVGTTLGLLFLNIASAVDSLEATRLRTENAQRVQDIQRLEQQVVRAGTPAELARAASAAGMVPAGPPAYLVIEPDGSSTVRGAPAPAGAGGN